MTPLTQRHCATEAESVNPADKAGTSEDNSRNTKPSKQVAKNGGGSKVTEEDPDEAVEAVVCQVDSMKDGEMREVDVADGKVLLIKDLNEFTAIGHKCSHYGAPLAKGVLSNGRVRCPWHGACFNTKTGDIEDFPGVDSIPCFKVRVEGSDVIVEAQKKSHRRIKKMSLRSADNDKVFLIIGGGGAGLVCAETLRQEGFGGRIVIATKEKHLPYDRPKLSKAMDGSAESIQLRKDDFFLVYDIEVKLEHEVVSIEAELNTVKFQNGDSLSFEKLLIATGGKPRTLDVPGKDLKNVCSLRSPDDANYIAQLGNGKNVVIVGSSFIGIEVASFFSGKAGSVTVIGRGSVPYAATLGEQIGGAVKKLAEEKGVKFHMNCSVKEFKGQDDVLSSIVLSNDEEISADVCVLGVGVTPATEFLQNSGLRLSSKNNVIVDKFLCTNNPDIYAAGDIAEFPLRLNNNSPVNIGHWQIAHYHGRVAALNMFGHETEVETVPFFWTAIFGKNIRFSGYNHGYDDVIISGSLQELKFIAYYARGDYIVAIATLNSDPAASKFAEFLASGKRLKKSQVTSEDPESWQSKL
ncbi:putative apoptosis-inducing factor 3 isoform X3 [Apostichopus japonicus]|uniref:Putative apoptosis-inducing factor 3 isoform X3 n=1 Tax=Stichopus japonicus TaxID=307972 RepID=A0A2G8L0C8_STIJA|nr:putative apoptosis-inducing factor 3 isoform X3 [Apostichopus japonicus]